MYNCISCFECLYHDRLLTCLHIRFSKLSIFNLKNPCMTYFTKLFIEAN